MSYQGVELYCADPGLTCGRGQSICLLFTSEQVWSVTYQLAVITS